MIWGDGGNESKSFLISSALPTTERNEYGTIQCDRNELRRMPGEG